MEYQVIKASGAIVQIDPREFERIVRQAGDPVVVHARTGVFSKKNQYLTSYKGLIFYCVTEEALHFGSSIEVLEAKRMWMPG